MSRPQFSPGPESSTVPDVSSARAERAEHSSANVSRAAFRSAKKRSQAFLHAALIPYFAFPYNERLPALRFEGFDILSVPRFVPLQLRPPITLIGFRNMGGLAIMRVPEAAVNENHLPARSEHQVRLSGKVFPMKPEPVSQPVRETPHLQFGLHILAPNRAHVCTTVHQRGTLPERMAFPVAGEEPSELP